MKVMFICTSNVCRSVMAEAFFNDIVNNDFNLNGKYEAYSAGIFAQDGDGPLFNVVEAMNEYNIDVKQYRSTSLRSSNIRDMDLILCAQESHKNVLLNICPDLKDKTFTLKEFVDDTDLDIIGVVLLKYKIVYTN